MMSISPGMSAGQAGVYFSKEDYYLRGVEQEDCTRWLGTGAESLGLTGEVREAEFRALCSGKDPFTGSQIVAPKITRDQESGKQVEHHRAGNDCTFSAPKSVSIAYAAGVHGIKEGHDAAVESVLEHIETHYCHYRSPNGIRNGGLVAAKFDHATSRNLDPQLHSHVFVLNAVRCSDGNYLANEPKALFQDQKYLGLLYRQELSHQLRERGFEIAISDRSQMFIELKGIERTLAEHFSSRRSAIETQVARWKEEGKFEGIPQARLHEMAALETREPKKEVTREDVQRNFERGFETFGTSSLQVRLELEQTRLKSQILPGQEAPEVVRLAAEALTDKEAVLDRARFLDEAARISGGHHGIRELNRAIETGTPGVERLGQDYRGRELFTTREMRRLEVGNLETVRGLAKTFHSVTSESEVNAFLDRLASEEGIRLSAGQRAHVLNDLVGEHGVAVTQGDPGTGKTFSSKIVERFNSEVLKPQGKEHFTVNVAFTGKAAREMSAVSGRPSFTIDSFLNAYVAGRIAPEGEDRPMSEPKDLIIPAGAQVTVKVDEVSFVGARQAEHLLRVVKELQQRGIQAKLQLTGDTKQMQAIQAGDLFRQVQKLGERGEVNFAHLTEINRQKDEGLLQIARTLNMEGSPLGENAKFALTLLKEQGAVIEKGDRGELVQCAVENYLALSRQSSRDPKRVAAGAKQSVLLITATNADRRELNQEIRKARIAAGEIDQGKRFPVLIPAPQGVAADSYHPGQSVVFSGSRRENGKMQAWGARLYTEGTITAIDPEKNTVTVSYPFAAKSISGEKGIRQIAKVLPAAEIALKTMVYNQEERSFSPGDRIVALRNDKGLGVQNGLLGEIKSVADTGVAVIDFSGKTIEVDLRKYNHIDHAYAVTLHKSQGTTVEQAIMFSYLKPGEEPTPDLQVEAGPRQESYGRASYNALNVAVTRAQYGAIVMTNTLSGLARAVEKVDVKTSTLNLISGTPRRLASSPPSLSPQAPGRGNTRSMDYVAAQLDSLECTVRNQASHHKESPVSHPGHTLPPLHKTVPAQTVIAPAKVVEMDLEK